MMTDIHPTKLAIMKAAVDVFIKKGFSGATTKEIAQTAGIAEGTVFRHFPNKAEILYGIVEAFIPLMGVDTLKQTIAECENLNIRDAVQHVIENRFQIIKDSAVFIRLILIESNFDSKLREIYSEQVYKPIRQGIHDFIAARIKRGDLKEMDPNLPTSVMISFILFEIIANDMTNLESTESCFTSKGLTDILLDGILKKE